MVRAEQTLCCLLLLLISGLIPDVECAFAGQSEGGPKAPNVKRNSSVDSFEARRAKLLDMLTSPEFLQGDVDSGNYSSRRQWQHYHACLATGMKTKEANGYFAESENIVADEWPVLLYIRTYFTFQDTVLDRDARERLARVMLDYKKNSRNGQAIERFGTNGNHSIVNFSMYLLLDQEFGRGTRERLSERRSALFASSSDVRDGLSQREILLITCEDNRNPL